MSLISRAHKIDNEEAPQQNQLPQIMPIMPALDNRKMATKQWLLSELVGMQKLFLTTTYDLESDLVFSYSDASSAFLNFVGTDLPITKYFLMANWKFEFLIEWQSHHQQVGALVLIQVPISTTAFQTYYSKAIETCNPTYFPHDFISLGHNGCLTVTTNFVTNMTHAPLVDYKTVVSGMYTVPSMGAIVSDDVMEYIRLDKFSPLNIVSGGQSQLTIRVWQKLVSLDLEAYTGNY